MGQARQVSLTKTLLEKLPTPKSGQAFYRHGSELPEEAGGGILDARVPGFAVRVTAAGSKAFVLERRVKGKTMRKKVCRVGELPLEQAFKRAEALVGEIAAGKDLRAEKKRAEAAGLTLEKAFQGYRDTRDLRPLTVRDVNTVLKDLADWKDRPLRDLTPDAVQKKHRQLSERSPARANLTMRYLRAAWNHALEATAEPDGTHVLPPNPVRRLSALKAWNRVDRRKTVIKRAELRAWFEAVNGLTNETARDFFQAVVLTGLRRGEAETLTWDQVDLDAGTLTVPAEKNKARRDHVLPLGTYLRDILKARKKKAAGPLVFSDPKGRPFTNARYALDAVEEASGVKFCIHDLRRTFATVAESLDISAYAVKRLLNHATAGDVTAGYLAESFDTDRLRAPMQRIEDTLLRLGGVKGAGEVVEFRRRRAARA